MSKDVEEFNKPLHTYLDELEQTLNNLDRAHRRANIASIMCILFMLFVIVMLFVWK